jgi:hypothetical protein
MAGSKGQFILLIIFAKLTSLILYQTCKKLTEYWHWVDQENYDRDERTERVRALESKWENWKNLQYTFTAMHRSLSMKQSKRISLFASHTLLRKCNGPVGSISLALTCIVDYEPITAHLSLSTLMRKTLQLVAGYTAESREGGQACYSQLSRPTIPRKIMNKCGEGRKSILCFSLYSSDCI